LAFFFGAFEAVAVGGVHCESDLFDRDFRSELVFQAIGFYEETVVFFFAAFHFSNGHSVIRYPLHVAGF